MFDDVKPDLQAGKEPEDMFDATDKVAPQVAPPTDLSTPLSVAAVSGLASGPAPSVEERVASISEKQRRFPWKVILLVIGILVVIGAVFLLSMKILDSRTPVTPKPPNEQEEAQEEAAKEEEEEKEEQAVQEETVQEEEKEQEVSRKDTDKDGLTDEEEEEFGTSIRTADTDSDGLFDLEEIKTWETDPLNPDTDSDGYLDGEEVNAGYNPDGEGILREAPTESS